MQHAHLDLFYLAIKEKNKGMEFEEKKEEKKEIQEDKETQFSGCICSAFFFSNN
jgi:hypothetical protein